MIQANELRTGNYVLNPEGIECSVQGKHITYLEREFPLRLQGIPLTPEWLERLGFTGQDGYYIIPHRACVRPADMPNRPGEWMVHSDSDDAYYNAIRPVKWVHQLQNLYFALHDEELTLQS